MAKTSNIDEANKLLAQVSHELVKLKMPTGNSDFRDILNSKCVYVDKTLLAKEIIDSGEKAILITRPRRWGKTLGMSMLKYFLALEVDEQGKELERNSNRALFDRLKIASTDTINEQGKHPVIFITLKGVKGSNYQKVENELKSEVSRVFKEYSYIYNAIRQSNKEADKVDRERFDRILTETANEGDIIKSIPLLSKLIKEYHGKLPILLIDEYDVPLNNSYNTDYYPEVLSIIRGLFEYGVKDNSNIKKAVITGVFKIAKSGLWTGMNNSSDYSILSSQYADYFGFTEQEVEALLLDVGIKDKAIRSEVKEWYNGYNIGGLTIYNPWSMINFFSRLQIAPYWVNTESMVAGDRRLSTDLMITEQIHDKVNLLIANFGKELTEVTINPEVVFSTVNQEDDSLWGLLLFGGYLSVESFKLDDYGLRILTQAKIPNKEILAIYQDSIVLWIKNKLSIERKRFDSLAEGFNLEDVKTIKSTIDKVLSMYGDRIAEKNESVLHGLIQSICLLKGDKHRLASESYTGIGRSDSIFYPIKGMSDTIIIHEYKVIKELKNEEQLKAALSKAIWQMYEKIYMDAPLVKNKYFSGEAKDVELRAIVILCDLDSRNEYSSEIVTRSHSIEKMKEIAEAFKSRPQDRAKLEVLRAEIDAEVEEYIRIYMPPKIQ